MENLKFFITKYKQPTKTGKYLGTRSGKDITEYTAEVSNDGFVNWFIDDVAVDAPKGWCKFPEIELVKKIQYTTDSTGKCSVFCGKTEIARSYLGQNGYSAAILQGMPRMETVKRIIDECPEFANANNMSENIVPKLFSK